jgi:hypothetical protein
MMQNFPLFFFYSTSLFPASEKKNKMLSNLYSGDGITSQREEGLDFSAGCRRR